MTAASAGEGLRASVVIAARDRRAELAACLASLEPAGLLARGVEVVVTDDGSTDGTAAWLASAHPEVRCMRLERSMGASHARNAGTRAARGRLILYLDSDGEIAPGWLEAMLARDDGATVLLGNVVDFEGGRVQGVPRRATFLGKSLRSRPERANTGPSCNLGAPRACFDAIGGFDEELPYYFEDSDFCIRARRAGFGFAFVAEAVFRHKGSERKRGAAIRLQEKHSTYAMLKAYAGSPVRLGLFQALNGVWLAWRLAAWTAAGRREEAALLWRGWQEAQSAWRARRGGQA